MTMRMKSDPRSVVYYELDDDVTAFSTTRHGGRSTDTYSSFNVCDYCGDTAWNVAINQALLCRQLSISPDRFVLPRQIHGTEIRLIDESFMTLPAMARSIGLRGMDGVITDQPGVCIGISTADCVPLLFYDPVRRVAGAAHAGWRGTVARMAAKTVRAMVATFGCDPVHIKALIGPCISVDCFEVGDEVYDEFSAAGFDMARIARRMDKWHIDLPECNALQMEQEGILPVNIIRSGICTYTDHDDYFSARRLGVDSGRIYTGIIIR